ncbi:5-formyltetrahydrofolate cyclo-ligase [Belliella kenyensis]|uniref:5-formyltetrahydrofolate cyclo-ligase n=1 Tax=Belliella kenyensis TaxID=1472724 RepID=A0ABV8EIU1_9BACT|nr:5-formyltetrahydrofolate cyclo-ligase [Belliella kenyensis]MCH7401299.1 5-formyltetrahydrofolate cyclo-ligase [Belliella kenyensis]MDN3602744.1 5-formyltetrahydrofolate cyclo-ligase [Belliella kenyensis]
MSRGALRTVYRQKRLSLSSEERLSGANQIMIKIIEVLKANPILKHIHVYLPIERLKEVDIFPLIERMIQDGYHLYTSIVQDDTGLLRTVKVTDLEGLNVDKWGIPTPKVLDFADEALIQMVIVPLLVYDKKGNRLGYGKGFYDKFLSSLNQEVLKIGVSFFPPEEQIESEWHDIPLDICITPKETFLF